MDKACSYLVGRVREQNPRQKLEGPWKRTGCSKQSLGSFIYEKLSTPPSLLPDRIYLVPEQPSQNIIQVIPPLPKISVSSCILTKPSGTRCPPRALPAPEVQQHDLCQASLLTATSQLWMSESALRPPYESWVAVDGGADLEDNGNCSCLHEKEGTG